MVAEAACGTAPTESRVRHALGTVPAAAAQSSMDKAPSGGLCSGGCPHRRSLAEKESPSSLAQLFS
jgi:hypothetical protein